MQSKWSDIDAQHYIDLYHKKDIHADIALRVYSSRLLGVEPELVLHGGGNVSVKLMTQDIDQSEIEAICVKGSGWDMSDIEPEGLPALSLAPLLPLAKRTSLSDEDMVAIQRRHLLNPYAPNPSIETLLHAFLPHKYIDHTHANAILTITNQEKSEEMIQAIYGDSVAVVPYVKPGFDLAKLTLEVYEKTPNVEGIILLNHGIFTFGETARESYERMISLVSKAEHYIEQNVINTLKQKTISLQQSLHEILPFIRAELTEDFVFHIRKSNEIEKFSLLENLDELSTRTCITPDHVIRTKIRALILPDNVTYTSNVIKEHIKNYQNYYNSYFKTHSNGRHLSQLDPNPRVIILPGIGMITLGKSEKEARIVADIFENTIHTVLNAEAIGRHKALSDADLFEMEYWSLEQAKLAKKKLLPLSGQVAIITGGLGTIGLATCKRLKNLGASVALFDKDHSDSHPGNILIQMDVTSNQSIKDAFNQVVSTYGGVDIVISNAGAAWQGDIGTVDEILFKESFELNFFAHQRIAQAAVDIFLKQKKPGNLLFNISKQAINPGKNFGPYGIPKAATLSLARQYALEYGQYDIRVNAVNPDRIRSGLLTDKLISSRSKARNVDEDTYMKGNLLKKEVTADDVAKAFEHLIFSNKTTGDVMTVDGGNISAVMR